MKIAKALQRLGYTKEWLETGIIDEKYLLKQYDEILTSEDKNAEHYRCGGFYHFLKSKKSLTDEEISNIFRLSDNGPDNCDLHDNRIIELIHSDLLSDEQLIAISKFKEVKEPPIQKRYNRALFIRKIDKFGITSEIFSEVQSTNDSFIHEYVLEHPDLNRVHLSWFNENGLNKKIRNISKQLLNSRKFRK